MKNHKINIKNEKMTASKQLTKTDRIIRDYIDQHRDSIIYMTIADLSDATKTSDASIIRFCRKYGYSGFQEMKISLARETMSPAAQIHEGISSSDTPELIIEKMFFSIRETLNATQRVLSTEQFVLAGDVLSNANRIVVFGAGSSGSIASDIAHKFMRLGFIADSYSDSHLQIIASCNMEDGDVAIGVSHSGNSRDIVEALENAKDNGATTISITNNSASPITQVNVSDIILVTDSSETKYRVWGQSSRFAQLAIVDSLYAYIAFRKGQETIDNIIQVDETLSMKKY